MIKFIKQSKNNKIFCESNGIFLEAYLSEGMTSHTFTEVNLIKIYGLRICIFCDILRETHKIPVLEDW